MDLPTDRPNASATEYAALIGAAIAEADKPIVVAHSASGLFLPLVPEHAQVATLVYLAAVIRYRAYAFSRKFKTIRQPIDRISYKSDRRSMPQWHSTTYSMTAYRTWCHGRFPRCG
jgi:hypothetical protein